MEKIYKHFLEHRKISTDSRKISAECIFFALSGENFNGNLFAEEALKKGAAYAIVDQDIDCQDPRLIRVENALIFLQNLATKHRLNFNIPIIAITGSNGKTTTKELMARVLSATYNVLLTQGNLNNHIGVPLTLFNLNENHDIAIIEMGANHQREIANLCEIAQPTHGLITNIGKAHLEGFGGIEGVKIGKGELFDFLDRIKGVAFANESEKSLIDLFTRKHLKMVTYSNHSKHQGFIDISKVSDQAALSLSVDFHNYPTAELQTNLQGNYNIPNIVNAICVGVYFRVPWQKIIDQVQSYIPNNNRSQLKIIGSNHFILDAYNANPSSMKLAIENFAKLDHPNKIAILGDMFELGEYSELEHANMAQLANECELQQAIFVGTLFPNANFKNVDELKSWFEDQHFENTYFLIKGSRGVALEKLLS
jgi:UDP-N-acetylmuramoyl-tripeptide--D-alanyl-D-alanine ligase